LGKEKVRFDQIKERRTKAHSGEESFRGFIKG